MKSILSAMPDGFGYYYGTPSGDHRQINLRYEMREPKPDRWWIVYVGGEEIAQAETFAEGERLALDWLAKN